MAATSEHTQRLRRALSSGAGSMLAAATQGVASLRPARKPLHPAGEVRAGRIYRRGSEERTGVAWLDEAGEDDVDVRVSRAVGLPRPLPDVHGLAIRVHAGTGDADLLLATTGRGRLTRFLLTMTRHPDRRTMTTLLPYETDAGPVLLAARSVGVESYELAWARASGEWHVFGVLRLGSSRGDVEISFDPVARQVRGLRQYPSVTRLRQPSYRRARRSRHEAGDGP